MTFPQEHRDDGVAPLDGGRSETREQAVMAASASPGTVRLFDAGSRARSDWSR